MGVVCTSRIAGSSYLRDASLRGCLVEAVICYLRLVLPLLRSVSKCMRGRLIIPGIPALFLMCARRLRACTNSSSL